MSPFLGYYYSIHSFSLIFVQSSVSFPIAFLGFSYWRAGRQGLHGGPGRAGELDGGGSGEPRAMEG